MKYILVAGEVHSEIGNNVVASSIGALLKACNLNVTAIKIDQYINIDARNFSPKKNGELFVLNDGSEVDQDLGNYERFLDIDLTNLNHITTGKIYQQVIECERKGDYTGRVEIIPHISEAIEEWIENAAKIQHDGQKFDICIIELGAIDSVAHIAALCGLQRRVKAENFCCVFVTTVSRVGEEFKSMAKISNLGISPNMIVCLSSAPIDIPMRDQISKFCGVEPSSIFNLSSIKNIYQVPIELENQEFIKSISSCMDFHACTCDRLKKWKKLSSIAVDAQGEIIIALVGDHADMNPAYTSVTRALEHACFEIETRPIIRFIDSTLLEDDKSAAWTQIKTSHCMIVPGGFGYRGFEGKIKAIKYARENKIAFLGICLGFQLAVIEFARSVLGWDNSHSNEFSVELGEPEILPVVLALPENKNPENKMSGTMRLGLLTTQMKTESLVKEKYANKDNIEERHRYRYGFNHEYIKNIQYSGLEFVGWNENGTRMDIFELDQDQHPYFVGVQFNPEYQSRPFKPSPPYQGLIEAANIRKKEMERKEETEKSGGDSD